MDCAVSALVTQIVLTLQRNKCIFSFSFLTAVVLRGCGIYFLWEEQHKAEDMAHLCPKSLDPLLCVSRSQRSNNDFESPTGVPKAQISFCYGKNLLWEGGSILIAYIISAKQMFLQLFADTFRFFLTIFTEALLIIMSTFVGHGKISNCRLQGIW